MNSSIQKLSDRAHCKLRFLGLQPYEKVWNEMREFTLSRQTDTVDEIWILQHEPVFTLGQAGKTEHILDAHDIPVIHSDRGGQVTYHGPGQLIIYLLIDVRRRKSGIRDLVNLIEQAVIRLLAEYDIKAETRPRAPGVYVDNKKIAALGLRIKRGCSYHGLSFNIKMDLTPFSYINPCGYAGLGSTQLTELLGNHSNKLFAEVQDKLLNIILSLL